MRQLSSKLQYQTSAMLLRLIVFHCLLFIISPRLQAQPAPPTPPPPPNYAQLQYWAAHPQLQDPADQRPAFIKNEPLDSSADVFYLHPTTFTRGNATGWNGDLADTALNGNTDRRPIRFQASVFNASCRVYAPRYRQAHFRSFVVMGAPQSVAALDLAYEDLKAAFQYYLDHNNQHRPIIIAAHSQGAYHAIRLLKEFFDGKPLQRQLVCAYVIGWPVSAKAFDHIPEGTSAAQTGCVVSWRCAAPGFSMSPLIPFASNDAICTNPLNWTAGYNTVTKEKHKGGMGRAFDKVYPQTISAAVDSSTKFLHVEIPEGLTEPNNRMPGNYHNMDYNLFYMDIRQNVRERIAAWQGRK
jgi:hypothetical protein